MADATTRTRLPPIPRERQPLIGVNVREGDAWVMRYYTSEEEADVAIARASRDIADIPWADVDQTEAEFHEMLDELDRIRHRNPPTPLPEPLP